MIVNTISEAKAQLSTLIEKARAGEEIVIAEAGKPVAVLTAYKARPKIRGPGALRGKVWEADDFDELPADIAQAFGMLDTWTCCSTLTLSSGGWLTT